MTDSARRDRRFPSKQELLVRCESWAEFAQLYASDVSQGGMFIITEAPPPILSEIEVDMQLPEGQKLQLKATVVHVVGKEQAEREQRQAGVGVHFLNLDAVHKQQIHQLVEFARWEGDSPSASYANRMFEASAKLPPSKVLEALPPEHATVSRSPAARSPSRTPPARPSQPAVRSSTRAGTSASDRPSDRGAAGAERVRRSSGSMRPAQTEAATPAEPAPPKPLDEAKLKLGMTHLAHRRFAQAIAICEELLKDTPGDRQATQWLHLAHARLRLKDNDADGAAEHYQKTLEVDENNHEARKFVREHYNKKRLNALPFGRYFVKK